MGEVSFVLHCIILDKTLSVDFNLKAERQLRMLFDQASKMQPSIIFFDEIDGLAPVRLLSD